jgi:copper chaperone
MTDSADQRWLLEVPGMTCAHCESAVREELGALSGVAGVEVDIEAKTVVVIGRDLESAALHGAIDEAGFEVTSASVTSLPG